MIDHCARLNVYVLSLIVQGSIFHPLMPLNVDTYAKSVKNLFELVKFMEVLMNVYLPYSFNC